MKSENKIEAVPADSDSVPKHVYLELLDKYDKKTKMYENMETEHNNLKIKLNDLEENQKALMKMTYPKTIKPRMILKARKSVTFKEQRPKIRLQSMETPKSTHPKNYTCHSCASRWAEWWRKEPEIHTFDSSSKLKKHIMKHFHDDFPEALPCPKTGCTWMAIEAPREELREDLRKHTETVHSFKFLCMEPDADRVTCGTGFEHENDYKCHLKLFHTPCLTTNRDDVFEIYKDESKYWNSDVW